MEHDPTCGPIFDDIAIKKLFTPDKPKDTHYYFYDEDFIWALITMIISVSRRSSSVESKYYVVLNGDFEEGPWMFRNDSLGVLLPTNLDEDISSLPGWIVESNRAVRHIDSYHFSVPQG
ncbi:hypothetical protein IFM89_013984 [Coptis chinensis]|uniref:Uncharacterized protein n=1 Tax=Coptis chinensis TaxID=261450 RepID=A0A835INX7_9MAGN|nr:hypothetical protein IFM89_013984 [Coptis chinensis]